LKIALTIVACTIGLMGVIGQRLMRTRPHRLHSPLRRRAQGHCLDTSRIDHLSFPDDRTILFHMFGGPVKIWRNDLSHECYGLKFEQGIAWTIWGNQVCSRMQVFYVLRRGTPCMLGEFTPYTRLRPRRRPCGPLNVSEQGVAIE